MKKMKNAKALYNFTKMQKNKDSTSTRDLNDSLDFIDNHTKLGKQTIDRKLHQRTQSCPSITQPIKLAQTGEKLQNTCRSNTGKTTRSQGGKFKPMHRNCQSQAQLESLYGNQCSYSIQNLSAVLYRKTAKDKHLKKSGVVSGKSKRFCLNGEYYNKARIEQQMKKYELNEQLKELEKTTKGISLKQQILQSLLSKFEDDVILGSQSLLSE